MKYRNDIEIFINDFVKDLNQGTASIFAGAGLSVPAGYVNWTELMAEIAQDLGLNISIEKDLVSLAQFHVNENLNRNKLNRKLLDEFTEKATETENHRIISRLPVASVWTTNYDQLIEKSFQMANKVVDVKFTTKQLLTTKPKRDVVVYKMHGDVNHPNDAVLTKEQYEEYHSTHESFINTLTGELTTKTFLFIGFSFSDPNLDYVLSRLNFRFKEAKRQHFSFIKKPILGDFQNPDQATLDYNLRRQALSINDLKRYGIKSIVVDDYSEITDILNEIHHRYKKLTVFISGSAETYDPFNANEASGFVHELSRTLIENDYRVVNGFGLGIGSSIINGALEAIYKNPTRFSENQLVLRPFPQFQTGAKSLPTLWEEYRRRMILQCGISFFLFGNKRVNDKIEEADGVLQEFRISREYGNICIPIALTNFASKTIFEIISENPNDYYENPGMVLPFLRKLSDPATSLSEAIRIISDLLIQLKQ